MGIRSYDETTPETRAPDALPVVTRARCHAGAAAQVRHKDHDAHAGEPRGRDLHARAGDVPLPARRPALHQRGVRGKGHRLQDQRTCGGGRGIAVGGAPCG